MDASAKPSRKLKFNEPCYCGSGKKWKKCCRFATINTIENNEDGVTTDSVGWKTIPFTFPSGEQASIQYGEFARSTEQSSFQPNTETEQAMTTEQTDDLGLNAMQTFNVPVRNTFPGGRTDSFRTIKLQHFNYFHQIHSKKWPRYLEMHYGGIVNHYENGRHAYTTFEQSHGRYGEIHHFENNVLAYIKYAKSHPDYGAIDKYQDGNLVHVQYEKGHKYYGEICYFDGGYHVRTEYAHIHKDHGTVRYFKEGEHIFTRFVKGHKLNGSCYIKEDDAWVKKALVKQKEGHFLVMEDLSIRMLWQKCIQRVIAANRDRRKRLKVRWQVCIRRVIKKNRDNRIQTALNRVESRRQQIVRERAAVIKAMRSEKSLSSTYMGAQKKVSKPTHWVSDPSMNKYINECKKQISIEATFLHRQKLREKAELIRQQEAERQEALRIDWEMMHL